MVTEVRNTYGPDIFDATIKDERVPIWQAIVKDAPTSVIAKFLGKPADVIDLEQIYRGPEDARRKAGRKWLGKKFTYACEEFCIICQPQIMAGIEPDTKYMMRWYESWRSIPELPAFANKPFITMEEMPVKEIWVNTRRGRN